MVEKATYILGAGFSAPLGLPVMANFLQLSKDMYARDASSYREFADVFHRLDQMARVKNYFRADLFNIEEVLSILEMESSVGGSNALELMTRFIKDVITYYTPATSVSRDAIISNPSENLFGERWRDYGYFVAGLLKRWPRVWMREGGFDIRVEQLRSPIEYYVVTLNYDNVLEMMADSVAAYETALPVRFRVSPGPETGVDGPVLAKLHGSVGSKIVPPTWNKVLDDDVVMAWSAAYEALKSSNYIRFVGYSLPATDAYVRYLIKAAVKETENLKQIDVLCLDSDGETRRRFDDFIDFPNYRYANSDVQEYLHHLSAYVIQGESFEPAHEYVMRSNSRERS